MVDFAVESYATARADAEALACAHWQETEASMYGEQSGVPITDEAFSGMESAGVLHVVTAREGGELAGYAVFVLAPNINMPGKVQASNLALYLAPGVRRDPFLAVKLLRWAEDSLRERGASCVAYVSPVSRPCDALFRRLGAKMTETTWHKEL